MKSLASFLTQLLFLAVLSMALPLRAEEYFVAPNGREHAAGTFSDPWSLEPALGRVGLVRPNDTIYLRGGVYATPDRGKIQSRIAGLPGEYITVRAYRRERVRIDGGLEILGGYVVFQDLEIFNSRTKRTSAHKGPFPPDILQPSGINVLAPGVKVVNNVVHDTATGLASWTEAPDTEFYGNIVYYNGWLGTDRPHGHGAYLQNRDGKKLLIDNIFYNQFDLGIQIYGTDNAFLNGFYLEGNVSFNNGALGGEFSRNLLIGGGVIAERPAVIENFTYYPTGRDHGGDNNVGYYAFGAGCSGLQFDGNYFVSGSIALTLYRCSATSFRKNTLIGQIRAFSAGSFPDNTYIQPPQLPTQNRVFVRPNRWEPGRAHVIVYNWRRDASIAVDLSQARLEEGDFYEIRDVQNLFGRPVAAGTYRGQPVTIPLTATAVSAAIGEVPFPATHTDLEFQTFLVRKVGTEPRSLNDPPVADYLEAEWGVISSPVIAFPAAGSSGGLAIASATANAGGATFEIDVPAEDDYVIWLRVQSPAPAAARVAVGVDGSIPELSSHISPTSSTEWRWVRVNGNGLGPGFLLNPRVFHLAPGRHTLELAIRDAHFYLDTVFISNDVEAVYGDTEVVASPVSWARLSAGVAGMGSNAGWRRSSRTFLP